MYIGTLKSLVSSLFPGWAEAGGWVRRRGKDVKKYVFLTKIYKWKEKRSALNAKNKTGMHSTQQVGNKTLFRFSGRTKSFSGEGWGSN
jgi:hypothetical protein